MCLSKISGKAWDLSRESSESLLGGDHGLDTVVHVLNELTLRAAKSALVGDVEGAIIGLGVLTMDASDLDVELVSNLLELVHVLGKLGQLDVHRGAEGSAEVGRARGDVAEMRVVSELSDLLNGGRGAAQAVEDGMQVGARLHGDDAELILLIDPNQEGLGVVVEDASALRPFAVQTASL